MKVDLRHYQVEAVQHFLDAERGIIQIPTGGGKTPVLGAVVSKTPGPWLVLMHRKILRDQTFEKLVQYGVKGVGRYGGEYHEVGRVTVATWQSVLQRYRRGVPSAVRLVRGAVGVAWDEVHTAAAPDPAELLGYTDPKFRLGLSATPLLRTDGRNGLITDYFGPVVYRIEADTLAMEGSLARPCIRFARGPEIAVTGYTDAIVRNHERNAFVAELIAHADKPAIALVNTVEHGLRLEAELRALKVKARLLWSEHEAEHRAKVIRQLVKGSIDVIIASPIFDVGVDIPPLRSAILGAGGRAPIACLQRLGRVMRPVPGKSHCNLWDVRDHGTRTAEESARLRAEAYSMAGFTVDFDGEDVAASTQPEEGLRDDRRSHGTAPDRETRAFEAFMFWAFVAVVLLWGSCQVSFCSHLLTH